MSGSEIKSHIESLLCLEETILSIDEIIQQLENYCRKLGNKAKIDQPIKQHVESRESSSAGWVAGFIVGAIVAIVKIVSSVTNNDSRLSDIAGGFFSGMIIGAIAGVVAGLIVNAIAKAKLNQDAQNASNAEYYIELDRYNEAITADKKRVDEENKQKSYIYGQIRLLENKRVDTNSIADEIYKYDFVPTRYWHDITALSYFNQYYAKQLDVASKDEVAKVYENAFSNYEDDKKRGLITSSQDIVSAGDYSIKKQRDLFRIMKKVYNVSSSVAMGVINESLGHSIKEKTVFDFIEEKKDIENKYTSNI